MIFLFSINYIFFKGNVNIIDTYFLVNKQLKKKKKKPLNKMTIYCIIYTIYYSLITLQL